MPLIPLNVIVPNVEYDKDVQTQNDIDQSPSLSGSSCPPRLKQFLDKLTIKPNEPPLDLNEPDIRASATLPRPFSSGSLSSMIANATRSDQPRNPESDSFAYMENLLEALAVLGKIGSALDVVSQRLPTEIYSLVDQTVDEVYERAEMSRRSTFYATSVQGRPSSIYVFADATGPGGFQYNTVDASSLRLAALESSEKRTDHETLRDFFWTLYSKLDAVNQGLRVVYEISNRIGAVSSNDLRLVCLSRASLEARVQGFFWSETRCSISFDGAVEPNTSRSTCVHRMNHCRLINFREGTHPLD